MSWPRIVAEALRGLPHAPLIGRHSAMEATPADSLRAIAVAQSPRRSDRQPPAFLLGSQVDSWRRVIAALEGWHGALLAEPVGTGKTWIALATAARESRPAVALIPAILRAQWEAAAAQAGVPLCCWTHERASRGLVPTVSPSLVIIDEAHRLRDPSTRRVRTIAPWLSGRRVLLLTATPIVNRLDDLVTLLQLALPDDALRFDGLPSLGRLAEHRAPPPRALRRVVIRSAPTIAEAITRRATTWPTGEAEQQRAVTTVAAIGTLTLSSTPGIRRLLASVLLDAAASSEAAFRATLGRYRALLLQARDAGGATRTLLRRFAGDALDQLVMWELVAAGGIADDLPLEDIDKIATLLPPRRSTDEWIALMLDRCADARPTVFFARHRATANALRLAAGDGAAWVTGSAAGIGPHRMARELVLAAFGPGRDRWHARRQPPTLLIATDVAAEGLDLQAAGRVVHVDLPWTATRLAQREGRLLRLGQGHTDVEVIVRPPPPAIETALLIAQHVHRKASLSECWLAALERSDPNDVARHEVPVAVVQCGPTGPRDLIAIEVDDGDRRGVLLLSRTADQPWQVLDDFDTIAASVSMPHRAELEQLPRGILDAATRAAVAIATSPSAGAPAAVITRIHALARLAARRRCAAVLAHLDRLLRFAASGHTLGEHLLLEQLTTLDNARWLTVRVPDRPRPQPVVARPIAALLFRSGAVRLR